MARLISVMLIVSLSGGCGSTRSTQPARTATEQLLISRAIDRAAERLNVNLASGTRALVDDSKFASFDREYAIGTIRETLARQGLRLVANRADADVIVEIRSGALSIDESESFYGVPRVKFPIPLVGALETPEVAVFKKATQQGIAKLAVTVYDARDNSIKTSPDPIFGFSNSTDWIVLVLINWTTGDILPEEASDRLD